MVFTSILYLAKQGLALRGHTDDLSNLNNLLLLRSEDVPALKRWLNRPGHKWIPNSIVNEILNILIDFVRKMILSKIEAAEFFSVMMDETPDISQLEQVSICLRIVKDLELIEFFMEFHDTPDTKSTTLLNLLMDFLKRNKLAENRLRGQCYDGARNMSKNLTGLQRGVTEKEPRALFVHCFGNCVNLCVQDALEAIPIIRDVIGHVKEMINFIRDSPKRKREYLGIKDDNTPFLTSFCSTRWTMRINSLKRFRNQENYSATVEFFKNASTDKELDPKVNAKAQGFLKLLNSFDFYFIVAVIIIIFDQIEILNTKLQSTELCKNESYEMVCSILENLKNMRNEEIFFKV